VISSWANFRFPSSLHASEKNNGLLQGEVRLGIETPWRQSNVYLVSFASVLAKVDHKGRAANNIIEPAFGMEIKRPFPKGGDISLGTKSAVQWRPRHAELSSAVVFYLKWYKSF